MVAAEAAKFLAKRSGVARAFTRTELSGPVRGRGRDRGACEAVVPPSAQRRRVRGSPTVLHSVEDASVGTGTTHGTPYDYDTHVPLLVYGPGIRGGRRDEPTTPQALASIFAKCSTFAARRTPRSRSRKHSNSVVDGPPAPRGGFDIEHSCGNGPSGLTTPLITESER